MSKLGFGFKFVQTGNGEIPLHYANMSVQYTAIFEPRRQKTGLRGFRPGPTQTVLYSHRIWLET